MFNIWKIPCCNSRNYRLYFPEKKINFANFFNKLMNFMNFKSSFQESSWYKKSFKVIIDKVIIYIDILILILPPLESKILKGCNLFKDSSNILFSKIMQRIWSIVTSLKLFSVGYKIANLNNWLTVNPQFNICLVK